MRKLFNRIDGHQFNIRRDLRAIVFPNNNITDPMNELKNNIINMGLDIQLKLLRRLDTNHKRRKKQVKNNH